MKKSILLILCSIVLSINSFPQAQSGGAKGGNNTGSAGGAGNGGGAATTAQIQTGYHYKIKYKRDKKGRIRKRHYFTYIYKYTTYALDNLGKRIKTKRFPYLDDSVVKRDTTIHVFYNRTLSVAISQPGSDSSELKIYFEGSPKEQSPNRRYEEILALKKEIAHNDTSIKQSSDSLQDKLNQKQSIESLQKELNDNNLLMGIQNDSIKNESQKSHDSDSTVLRKLSEHNLNFTKQLYSINAQLSRTKVSISAISLNINNKKAKSDSLNKKLKDYYPLSKDTMATTSGFLLAPKVKRKVIISRELEPDFDTLQNMYMFIRNSYFLNQPSYFIKLPFSMGQFGALTIPFQYEFGYKKVPNNFSASVNLAVYYGRVWGRTKFFLDPNRTTSRAFMIAIFGGPTVIALSPTNTTNNIAQSAASNQIGLSTGIALSVNLRYFNLGLFEGINIPSSAARDYDYAWSAKNNPMPWIGFGIGFNIPMFAPVAIEDYNK
jgi:hypothetical protein